MDIAGLSMNMAQNNINSAVGQVKMITEASVNGVGANFDMRV